MTKIYISDCGPFIGNRGDNLFDLSMPNASSSQGGQIASQKARGEDSVYVYNEGLLAFEWANHCSRYVNDLLKSG